MKTFQLNRIVDESGVSGTGIVAEGVEFTNGKCAVSWLTEYTSIVIYDNMESVIKIHGHNGNTKIEYTDKSDPTIIPSNEISTELQLKLTSREYELLVILKEKQGSVVTHLEIAFKIWGETREHLVAYMTRPLCAKLRKKIGQEKIQTVWGRGYMYIGE